MDKSSFWRLHLSWILGCSCLLLVMPDLCWRHPSYNLQIRTRVCGGEYLSCHEIRGRLTGILRKVRTHQITLAICLWRWTKPSRNSIHRVPQRGGELSGRLGPDAMAALFDCSVHQPTALIDVGIMGCGRPSTCIVISSMINHVCRCIYWG